MKAYNPLTKFFIYCIVTIILAAVSFFLRNILAAYFNNCSFFFFDIDFVKNTGAAFSLFQSHTDCLIVISVVILFAVVVYVIKHIKELAIPSVLLLSLFTSGVLGNLLERIIDGYVTDYIKLTFVDFPIFNLSDIFINIAVFLIICNILFKNEKQNV